MTFPVQLIATSEIKVSCVIPVSMVATAVRALHKEFELENNYLWGGAFVSATT